MRPEAAALFQSYMQAKSGSRNWNFREVEREVVKELIRLGEEIGGPATLLRSDVAELVSYTSTDLVWLREKFDVSFDDIDYSRLNSSRRGAVQVHSLP